MGFSCQTCASLVGGALLGAALISAAAAQTRNDGKGKGSGSFPALTWIDCTSTSSADRQAAIVEAQKLLGKQWLSTERGYFAAYTMAGEVRNPFDLSPKAPDSGPRDGIVQARPPRCTSAAGEKPGAFLVRFVSPYFRFHEAGPGWSAPLADGLMLEVAVEHEGSALQARDVSADRGILLPDQKPHVANAATLPADAKWALPMMGCPRKTSWNGEACVARKR